MLISFLLNELANVVVDAAPNQPNLPLLASTLPISDPNFQSDSDSDSDSDCD